MVLRRAMAFRAFLISLALLLPASASAIDVAVYGWPSDAAWNIDVGNKIEVIVINVDDRGKVKLSAKAVNSEPVAN